MLDKQAIKYLKAMDISLWSPRQSSSHLGAENPVAPLYIAAQQLSAIELRLLKQVVAAIDIDWQQVKVVSPEHLPVACQSLVLWAAPNAMPVGLSKGITLDLPRLLSQSQAKRQLWKCLCQQT